LARRVPVGVDGAGRVTVVDNGSADHAVAVYSGSKLHAGTSSAGEEKASGQRGDGFKKHVW
jgi:hypothetical protein